jgi:YVTN family beta-propeller protein
VTSEQVVKAVRELTQWRSIAYVANWFSGDVSVLDVVSGRELKRIPTGGGSRALAVAAPVPTRASQAPGASVGQQP